MLIRKGLQYGPGVDMSPGTIRQIILVSMAGYGSRGKAISRRNVGLYTVRYCGCYKDENDILFASKHTTIVTVRRFSSSGTCLPTPIGLQEMKSDLQYKQVVSARRHPASTASRPYRSFRPSSTISKDHKWVNSDRDQGQSCFVR